MTRKEDLETAIQESYELIREYEAIIRTSDRPKEKARARREIEEQQALIKGYQAELNTLTGDNGPREEQTEHPPTTQIIHTGGGMYVAGNVINKGVMVGRDQQVDGDVVQGDKVGGDKVGGDKSSS